MKRIIALLFAICLVSCSEIEHTHEGVVVDKEYHSSYMHHMYVGKMIHLVPIPEKHVLVLRDSLGNTRRVGVTVEVYDAVAVGQYVKLE